MEVSEYLHMSGTPQLYLRPQQVCVTVTRNYTLVYKSDSIFKYNLEFKFKPCMDLRVITPDFSFNN